MVMEMNYVDRNQSQKLVTPFTVQLKRNQTCFNIDLQKYLSKESDKESKTESIDKKTKKLVAQSTALSENDDDYHDKYS